jgi:hypothetical protein
MAPKPKRRRESDTDGSPRPSQRPRLNSPSQNDHEESELSSLDYQDMVVHTYGFPGEGFQGKCSQTLNDQLWSSG